MVWDDIYISRSRYRLSNLLTKVESDDEWFRSLISAELFKVNSHSDAVAMNYFCQDDAGETVAAADEAACIAPPPACSDDTAWAFASSDCAAFMVSFGVDKCGLSAYVGTNSDGASVTGYEACEVSCPLDSSSSHTRTCGQPANTW